jgi:hypothetical protein
LVNNRGINFVGTQVETNRIQLDSGTLVRVYYDDYFDDVKVRPYKHETKNHLFIYNNRVAIIKKIEKTSPNLWQYLNSKVNKIFGRE